jgi:alanyl-tRNA synthetase
MSSFLEKECKLNFFIENGYIRKKCKSCKDYFWTLNNDLDICGDKSCKDFSFINNPMGYEKLSLNQVREYFTSFFENKNHSKLFYPITGERCPVIARWRSDIYLTIASIADFQPHVTSGEVPPPANPLVISQPCIRLNDLEQVGISGRHLTTFEMMGHHAFNKNIDEIYWKEDTVHYCDEFFVNKIGIERNEITYKEQLWYGGGNAGPCLEVLSGGLEIATLVFMNLKKDANGSFNINGEKYIKNPLNIVDTGYGLERISWLTNGTKTIYDVVFPKIIERIYNNSNNKHDSQSIYSLADHSKCIAFMLGDGIVPSNVKAGYLARLIIRRSIRFIKKLKLDVNLKDLVEMQLELLKNDFPSLITGRNQIFDILTIETKKYADTILKGESLVKKLIKNKDNLDNKKLIMLYDTHGMPPDLVKKISKKEGVEIQIPSNFDSMIAELHSHYDQVSSNETIRKNLPLTKILFYEDHYLKEFDAEILWKNKLDNYTEIILDKTSFYPEGGGQPGDRGFFIFNNKKIDVKRTLKEGKSIIHIIDGDLSIGDKIHANIDWNYRYSLMKHHTGTHVLNASLRKTLGEHIWQAGSQISFNEARFDFAHYKKISDNELKTIEKIANGLVKKGKVVEKKLIVRNTAEKMYGFRLYQGGVPPGNMIRVINIPGLDVEACGGTHLNNIDEIEQIRILKSERIQDGVNRITFTAGKMVEAFQKQELEKYNKIIKIIGYKYKIKNKINIENQLNGASKIFSVPVNQLESTIKRFISDTGDEKITEVTDLKEASEHIFIKWKKINKIKRKKSAEKDVYKNFPHEVKNIGSIEIIIIPKLSKSFNDFILAGKTTKEKEGRIIIIGTDKGITCACSNDLTKKYNINCSQIIKESGRILGGGGGGTNTLAQAGGPEKNKIKEAIDITVELIIKILDKF